jgi:hypothetical protein
MSSQPMATWTPRSSRSEKFVGTRTFRHTMEPIPVSQNLTCRFASVSAAGFSSGTGLRPSLFRPNYRLVQLVRRRTPQRSRCSRAFLVACTRRGGQHPVLCSSRRIRQVANGGDRRTVRARQSHVALPLDQTVPALVLGAGSSTIMRCIMPERLATTDPFRQVTEVIGSGPCRFLPSLMQESEPRMKGLPDICLVADPNRHSCIIVKSTREPCRP